MENTPAQITDAVLDFCRSIRQDQQPEYVSVNTIANDEARDCYGNVEKKIENSGGSILYGWAIWLDPDRFIEAEHHSVWVAPDGHKECVSHQTNTNKILFLPDPENVFKNALIPNRRKALIDDPRLHRWLTLCNEHDRLKAKNAVFNDDGTLHGFAMTDEVMAVEFGMVQLQMEMGMIPSEADMMEGMRGLEVMQQPKPRANLTPAQRAEMVLGIEPVPRKQPRAVLTPKERAEERKKQRKREKRHKK